jgi:hypothetical protein
MVSPDPGGWSLQTSERATVRVTYEVLERATGDVVLRQDVTILCGAPPAAPEVSQTPSGMGDAGASGESGPPRWLRDTMGPSAVRTTLPSESPSGAVYPKAIVTDAQRTVAVAFSIVAGSLTAGAGVALYVGSQTQMWIPAVPLSINAGVWTTLAACKWYDVLHKPAWQSTVPSLSLGSHGGMLGWTGRF